MDKKDGKSVLRLSAGGPPRKAEEVIGRDIFVEELMEHLDSISVQINAPRRIGKSWMLVLLEEKAKEQATTIYTNLEKIHSPYEFVDNLASKTKLLSVKIGAAIGKLLKYLAKGHGKMDDYEFPWKDHLEKIFQNLNEHEEPVWLLFDEFPIFLDHLISIEKPLIATNMLDYLRYARSEYKNIKFVFTGSIGIHWIISKLEEEGWRNPQNDVKRITLKVLEKDDAIYLAESLLRGINKSVEDAQELVEATSCHPFYIQRAISVWKKKKPDESAKDFCDRIAMEIDDIFEFRDLENRLGHYFGRQAKLAKRALDCLASDQPLSARDIADELNSDPEEIKEILDKLEMDGYTEIAEKKYHLWPPLFRRWWEARRGGLYD